MAADNNPKTTGWWTDEPLEAKGATALSTYEGMRQERSTLKK